MYTPQVNVAANATTSAKKTTTKADSKADQSFANVLSQKADTTDPTANQPQQTKNDTASDQTTTAQQNNSKDTQTNDVTTSEAGATNGEDGGTVEVETELMPEMMFLLNIPAPTQNVEVVTEEVAATPTVNQGGQPLLTQEAVVQTTVQPEAETNTQQNVPIVQSDTSKATDTNTQPKNELPTMMTSEQTIQTTEEAAPTVRAEIAETDVTDERPKTEQPTQTVAAPQNREGFRQESIEVKIPVSDSSSILQRQTTRQVTDQIISQFKDGVQQFTLSLHPEHLGHVVVNMAFEHGSLHLRVQTSNQLAQNLLIGGLADLKNTLNENGIQVSDVDISPFAEQRQSEQQHDAQHSNFGGGQNNHHGGFSEEIDEEAEDDALLAAEGLLDYSI